MIFHLLIVFLFTFNMIHSEGQGKEYEKFFKIINDKVCADKPDQNLVEKIAVCENSLKTTVNMNIEFKIDQFDHFHFHFYQKFYELLQKCIESPENKEKPVICSFSDGKVITNKK